MTEDTPDFATGIKHLREQIGLRLSSMRRGLDKEVIESREATDAIRLARAYVAFRQEWDVLQDHIKEVKGVFAKLQEVDFPDMLQTAGLMNVPLEDEGYTVGMQVRTKASIVSGAKEEAIEFFRADATALEAIQNEDWPTAIAALKLGEREKLAKKVSDEVGKGVFEISEIESVVAEIQETTEGLEALVTEQVSPQTLSKLAKDWADEGKELPEALFNTFLQPSTTMRKNTKRK